MKEGGQLLAIRDVTITFGGLRAVDALSFDVPPGAIIALIGPNGAGKTTLLNSISGFVPARGSIRYKNKELLPLPALRRAGLGIGRTFQNLLLFSDMTLVDNVLTGRHTLIGGNLLLDMLHVPVIARERQARTRALEILSHLGLGSYAQRRAWTLPFGVQKLAAVARALAAEPDLLLLDEPAAGLNQQDVEALAEVIVSLRNDLGVTILLVEHNMRLVMKISDSVVALDEGRKLAEGLPADVGHNVAVIEAYLGAVQDPAILKEVEDELAEHP